jgi:RNA polymerase sigma factor (sigma-70 family)
MIARPVLIDPLEAECRDARENKHDHAHRPAANHPIRQQLVAAEMISVTDFPVSSVLVMTRKRNGASAMVDDVELHAWFCREVLPLERTLMRYIERNWRIKHDVQDIRQEIYEALLSGCRNDLPINSSSYIFTTARNLIINRSRRARIVSFEILTDANLDASVPGVFPQEDQMIARDELRRTMRGLDELPPRCREVVRLRKVEGFSTRETAEHLGVSIHTVERQLTLGMRALANFMLGGSGKIDRMPLARGRGKTAI